MLNKCYNFNLKYDLNSWLHHLHKDTEKSKDMTVIKESQQEET